MLDPLDNILQEWIEETIPPISGFVSVETKNNESLFETECGNCRRTTVIYAVQDDSKHVHEERLDLLVNACVLEKILVLQHGKGGHAGQDNEVPIKKSVPNKQAQWIILALRAPPNNLSSPHHGWIGCTKVSEHFPEVFERKKGGVAHGWTVTIVGLGALASFGLRGRCTKHFRILFWLHNVTDVSRVMSPKGNPIIVLQGGKVYQKSSGCHGQGDESKGKNYKMLLEMTTKQKVRG